MDENEPSENDETLDAFIARHSGSIEELRETISFLIHRRELLRDCEIEALEKERAELVSKLANVKRRILLEEVRCFREVLELHKRLIDHERSSS